MKRLRGQKKKEKRKKKRGGGKNILFHNSCHFPYLFINFFKNKNKNWVMPLGMGYAFCWVYHNNTTMLEVAWIFMSIISR
jgi:hypothetical protein